MRFVEFDRLAAKHRDAVYRQMVRMCGNHDDAEDVLMEALARAYRSMGSLRDEDSFRGWLAIIGRRLCGRLRRREDLLPLVSLGELQESGREPVATIASADEVAQEIEMHGCIQRAVNLMPEAYRAVYVLRDIAGKTNEEAASELGLTVAAVKSRLHRARAMLRRAMDGELGCQGYL